MWKFKNLILIHFYWLSKYFSRCYCIDQDGKRIFGEAAFTSLPDFDLQCSKLSSVKLRSLWFVHFSECSRDYTDAAKIIGQDLNPGDHFRCAPNGDYDILQCIEDKCLCVDANDGAPSYPDKDLVNITLISKDKLPCCKTQSST